MEILCHQSHSTIQRRLLESSKFLRIEPTILYFTSTTTFNAPEVPSIFDDVSLTPKGIDDLIPLDDLTHKQLKISYFSVTEHVTRLLKHPVIGPLLLEHTTPPDLGDFYEGMWCNDHKSMIYANKKNGKFNSILFGIFADALPQTKRTSMTPVMLVVYNLPPSIRNKMLLCVGVSPDKHDDSLSFIIDKVVSEILEFNVHPKV